MDVNKLKTKKKQFESSAFNDPSLMVTTCGTVGEIQDFVPVGSSRVAHHFQRGRSRACSLNGVQFSVGLANNSILGYCLWTYFLIFKIMVYVYIGRYSFY